MKRMCLTTFFLFSLTIFAYSFTAIDAAGLKKYTDNFIESIKSSKYNTIFDYFFIPSDYTKNEIKIDKYVIENSLKYLFKDLLGEIINYSMITDKNEIMEAKGSMAGIAVGNKSHHPNKFINIFSTSPLAITGKPAYQDSYCTNIYYNVNFAKFGECIIVFLNYTKNGTDFKIYKVDILFPKSNSKSSETYNKFINYINKAASEIK